MPLNGHRILVVEDEFIIAFDLQSIIRNAHGDVAAHAARLTQAMKLAETPRLSLALLDFRLGSENSLPVASKLHALGIPFIFHTGCGISEVTEAWPNVPVIAKPAAPHVLIGALISVARKRPPPIGRAA